MSQQRVTSGIVLTRVDYGEADRIITVLTPNDGKLRLMAKGVRRIKSKLAGGVELFSLSSLTYITGRGEIGTLISSRLETHYGRIVQDIDRTMLGYELIKLLHKATEDEPEAEYFELLHIAFAALDDATISPDLIRLWFSAQLLRLSGHTPNLLSETGGTKLAADKTYEFSFDDSAFYAREGGSFGADTIKFLRLVFSGNSPAVLKKVQASKDLTAHCLPFVRTLMQTHLRM